MSAMRLSCSTAFEVSAFRFVLAQVGRRAELREFNDDLCELLRTELGIDLSEGFAKLGPAHVHPHRGVVFIERANDTQSSQPLN